MLLEEVSGRFTAHLPTTCVSSLKTCVILQVVTAKNVVVFWCTLSVHFHRQSRKNHKTGSKTYKHTGLKNKEIPWASKQAPWKQQHRAHRLANFRDGRYAGGRTSGVLTTTVRVQFVHKQRVRRATKPQATLDARAEQDVGHFSCVFLEWAFLPFRSNKLSIMTDQNNPTLTNM